jgi:23S rRNA (cytidine1920-2'-O)/16S rRNA (cytidine1409-2'-O)-methyltransferase
MHKGPFVGRGGEKLDFALDDLEIDVKDRIAADFGCNIGGFTDCMLQRGAEKVYAVDTGYGMLEWKLRKDDRVVVMERTNAMHVDLPETVDLVTIDVAWTQQRYILPSAARQLNDEGFILSLFKPQYEADDDLVHRGVVDHDDFDEVLEVTLEELADTGFHARDIVRLPPRKKSKNREAILHIRMEDCDDDVRK